MISQDVILSQLEGTLNDVNVGQLGDDDKVRIAETIVGLQMQLDMLNEKIDQRVEAKLNALMVAAGKAKIVWN